MAADVLHHRDAAGFLEALHPGAAEPGHLRLPGQDAIIGDRAFVSDPAEVARLAAGERALAIALVEQASGRLAGSTRYGNIDMANRRVEIGWTWVGRPWQRTAANTEAKYLLLRQASRSWAASGSS